RIRLAVRVRREQRHVLGDSRAEGFVAGAARIAEDDALAGVARRTLRTVGNHQPDHGVLVMAELDVGLKLHRVAAGWHVERERDRLLRREVIAVDRAAVWTHAESQLRGFGRG